MKGDQTIPPGTHKFLQKLTGRVKKEKEDTLAASRVVCPARGTAPGGRGGEKGEGGEGEDGTKRKEGYGEKGGEKRGELQTF